MAVSSDTWSEKAGAESLVPEKAGADFFFKFKKINILN